MCQSRRLRLRLRLLHCCQQLWVSFSSFSSSPSSCSVLLLLLFICVPLSLFSYLIRSVSISVDRFVRSFFVHGWHLSSFCLLLSSLILNPNNQTRQQNHSDRQCCNSACTGECSTCDNASGTCTPCTTGAPGGCAVTLNSANCEPLACAVRVAGWAGAACQRWSSDTGAKCTGA